jgi:hypothetical protein
MTQGFGGPTTEDDVRRMEEAAALRDDELAARLAEDPAKLVAVTRDASACTRRLYYTERRVQARACAIMSEALGEPVYDVRAGAERMAALLAELRQRPPGRPTTGLPLLDWQGDGA